MRIINTATTLPTDLKNQWERDQIYNGLDCCITAEILDVLLPQLDSHTGPTYDFSRSLQGPALEMRLRGVLIDKARKAEVVDEYFESLEFLDSNLQRIVLDGVGLATFNWRSPADLQRLFYTKLGIPVIKKAGRPTVNRDALEKMESYTVAKQIVAHLKALRDIGKKISVLQTEIDPDGRMRTSYNIAGTNTGRFSSSFSEFGTGGNLQNVEESLRSVFIADPGMKFAKFDAAQIQSRIVGGIEWNLFKDGKYLDACEKDDLHTVVAKMVWPNHGWTGDMKKDRAIAEQPYYRHYDRRFMCKKIGHGTNFNGKPPTIAAQSKIPITLISEFQPKYFIAFPAHQRWHAWVENQIRTVGQIISITGRKRQFWGRRNDDATVREAIAYDPQASESFIVNNAMLNIWRRRTAIIMMHEHDGLVFMYPEEREDEIFPLLEAQLRFPVPLKHDRVLDVPFEGKVGWNRGDYHETKNPDGLKSIGSGDKRRRTPPMRLLDRKFR